MKQMPVHKLPYKPPVHVHLWKNNHRSGRSKQYCQDYQPDIGLCHTLAAHVYLSQCCQSVARRQAFQENYLHNPDAQQLCRVQRWILLKEESNKMFFSFFVLSLKSKSLKQMRLQVLILAEIYFYPEYRLNSVREPLIKSVLRFVNATSMSHVSWMNSLSPGFPIAALASTCNSPDITRTYRLALEHPESQSVSPRFDQRFLSLDKCQKNWIVFVNFTLMAVLLIWEFSKVLII